MNVNYQMNFGLKLKNNLSHLKIEQNFYLLVKIHFF